MTLSGLTVSSRVYPSTGDARAALILAHGAGAGQLHPFMAAYAQALASAGLDVVTFNFPYMDQKRRLPDRAPVLEQCYRHVIETVSREVASAGRALFIGGKSMGGRIATHVAAADANLPLTGLVLLGYPLHPPGRPDKRRDAHLPHVGRPALFVQGSRDTFGTPEELHASARHHDTRPDSTRGDGRRPLVPDRPRRIRQPGRPGRGRSRRRSPSGFTRPRGSGSSRSCGRSPSLRPA